VENSARTVSPAKADGREAEEALRMVMTRQ
jgi:hypothetical protein